MTGRQRGDEISWSRVRRLLLWPTSQPVYPNRGLHQLIQHFYQFRTWQKKEETSEMAYRGKRPVGVSYLFCLIKEWTPISPNRGLHQLIQHFYYQIWSWQKKEETSEMAYRGKRPVGVSYLFRLIKEWTPISPNRGLHQLIQHFYQFWTWQKKEETFKMAYRGNRPVGVSYLFR